MMGKAAAGFSDGLAAEAIGDLGLSLVFIGMCFRSTELAILAYISDPAKREAAIEKLRQKERAKRPWISHLMNAGWVCLLAGVATKAFGSNAFCLSGCSSMVEQKPSKLTTRVRFPSPAPVPPMWLSGRALPW